MKINKMINLDVFKFLYEEVQDKSVDLAIVDPPYNVLKESWDSFKTEDEYWEFTFKWIDKLLIKMKNTGSLYLFNNYHYV